MRKRTMGWIIFFIALFIVVVELFPILIVVLNGFKKDIDIWSRNPFYFKPTLASYKKVFENEDFVRGLKNSLIAASISSFVSVFFGSMASYGLSRYRFKINDGIIFLLLLLRMVPQITLSLPFYLIFKKMGLSDNILGLSLAHISFNLPYAVALLLPFFEGIPRDFEEAAKIDGCKDFQIYWRIFFPLASAGIVVAAVFTFLMSWNEFIYALVLTGVRAKTAPVAVNGFLGQYAPLWGQLSAAGTIMLIPVFAITLGFQRYIIKGLSAGGIKG
ncbi:carbohydrate ABC transporter permease [Thermotoga sp. KOL6]|uniref:carbohydrate ABC transporter permease n=1 Tax=Thermotoga sp. KOL6 TaxID=126741 RepID=UPI000C7568A9|nr:carbohydrate ABC transporter permease [Thermotoga sp. KOL6]PLV59163.1 ABC transporter permease [Thermotoga sp. KOL6]